MSQLGETKKSLRFQQPVEDVNAKRNEIMMQIKEEEENFGDFVISQSIQRNVVLVGRTRTGKSTIKSMLIDSMVIAEEIQLVSGTKDPVIDTFHIKWRKTNRTNVSSDEELFELDVSKENLRPTNNCENMVLNIIDTPGLFERGTDEIGVRDNEIIMKAIDTCINAEITKFHVICFCVALTSGINQEDIQALKLLLETIGNQISSNACLIITHCESKDKEQRKALRMQLMADKDFKLLVPFFKKGIFFTGVLKREDYKEASKNLIKQFLTVTEYRAKLIEMFSETIKPFALIDTLISESQRNRKSTETLQKELDQAKKDLSVAQNSLLSTTEELKQTNEKLQSTEMKLIHVESELKQRHIDQEDKTNELALTKSTEASLRNTIKDLQDKYASNECEREALKTNLELEEKQRRQAETERQCEMEARREAERQRMMEHERRHLEQVAAYEKYCKQVEAQQEEARRRMQAEHLLEETKNKPCSIS